ncbi:thrombospondin type-1 domain-containing protein 1 isoform X2 [Pseudophryne corroboree]|uniref:thrombospondin type-1 domain-containing protein 1 isoform X2 n=1 Tax=Pseudophryne corroboree TaxID=495146 RepID=UPI003081D8C5
MSWSLSGYTYISLLLLLWDCVFSEFGYLHLRKTHHTALSKAPVYVDYYTLGNASISSNVSVILLDVKSNQTVTSKELPANQSQGYLEFECFHFLSTGVYQFEMQIESGNDSVVHITSSKLNVTWPTFHIDLNRTSRDMLRSFQVGVFTNEQLCSGFPGQEPRFSLEVEHTHSFQEAEEPSNDRFMLYKTYKDVPLSASQWVEFECASVRPEAFITVFLKPMLSESVIAYTGPVDLLKTFKYKLVTVAEKKCDSSMAVQITAPPCNYIEGKMIVYKESPRSPGESVTTLAENIIQKGEKNSRFNCSLFEIGKNKYCFEFLMSSSGSTSYSVPSAKQCVEIRREIAVKPSSKSATNTKDDSKTSNTVTITGISLCLFIIFITIVITVWRKFTKASKCSLTARHSSTHSPNCRKNSDEEKIYQMRESFSDVGDGQQESLEEVVHIPLNYRQSEHVTEEQAITENDCSQANQKIIPPIFSYRLAQLQLKEMKQKGLTEATKVYHVSQNPMADTALDVSLPPPQVSENSDETATNKFRIQSPFLEPKNSQNRNIGERPNSRCVFPPTQRLSPSQTLPKVTHLKNTDAKARYDKGYQKSNNFRRTSSFHETKHNKPYRERSLTSPSPRHTMVYNSRTKMWEYATVERSKHKPIRLERSPENLTRGASFPLSATGHPSNNQYLQPGESKPDLICSRYIAGKSSKLERPEQIRVRKGPSPVDRPWNKVQDGLSFPKDNYQRSSPHSPAHYRREKCQSFPWGNEYSFYDNTTFGLTEAEQQMIDLPGYFASNEEDETSTLSIERLVM